MKTQERSWKAVGEFIRSQRRLADLSLRQLSALAQVSNPYLSQIERGIHKPSADVLKGIADALHISAEKNDKKSVALLLEAKADVNAATTSGLLTALHRAVYNGSGEIVEMLLAHGANQRPLKPARALW